MTEKRFALIDMNNIEWLLISPIKDNGRDLTVKQVVELLNEQHEEIEELKRRFKRVLDNSQSCHKYFDLLEQIIDEICNDDISNQIWVEYEKREKMVE